MLLLDNKYRYGNCPVCANQNEKLYNNNNNNNNNNKSRKTGPGCLMRLPRVKAMNEL